MPAKIPSVDNGALGGRPRASVQRGVVTYQPVVAPSAGAGLAEFGKEVTAKADKILTEYVAQEEDNQLKQAQIDFSKAKLSILNGDGDQDPGFVGNKGQDALDKFGDYNKRLDEARGKIFGSLKGNVAKTFDMWSQNEAMNARGTMTQHLNGERVAVRKQKSIGFINQMQNEIAANPNNDKLVGAKRMEIMRVTLDMADENGIKDKDARSALVRSELTKAHKASIANLLAVEDVDGAKAYLDRHRGDIDQLEIGAMEKAVNSADVTTTAQKASGTAMSKFKTEEEALQWIYDNFEGAVEKAAVSEVERRFRVKDRAKTRDERDAVDQGHAAADKALADPTVTNETEARAKVAGLTGKARDYAEQAIGEHYSAKDREDTRIRREAEEGGQAVADKIFAEGGDNLTEGQALEKAKGEKNAQIRKQAEIRIKEAFAAKRREEIAAQKSLRAEANKKANAGDLSSMTQEERDAVDAAGPQAMASLEKRAESVRRGLPQVSDESVRTELVTMRRDRPLAFAKIDLHSGRYLGKLDAGDLEKFENWQIGVDKNAAASKRLTRAMSISAKLLKGRSDAEISAFNVAMGERLDEYQSDKPITDKEIQEMAMGLLIRGENASGSWYSSDTDTRGFSATPNFYTKDFASENKPYIEELAGRSGVPIKSTGVIVESLLQGGHPVTASTIKKAYDEALARRNAGGN